MRRGGSWILRFHGGVRFILIVWVFPSSCLLQRYDADYPTDIPRVCLLHLSTLVITDSEARSTLFCAALRRNLPAHAESNLAIAVGGTKDEIVLRLEEVLRMRKLDLLIGRIGVRTVCGCKMVFGFFCVFCFCFSFVRLLYICIHIISMFLRTKLFNDS